MERLTRRAEFLRTARGRKWVTPGLVLQARRRNEANDKPDNEISPPRVGFTASRRVGGAVQRNRAKRRLRALAGMVLDGNARAGFDYVLIARRSTLNQPYQVLLDELKLAIEKVHTNRQHRHHVRNGQTAERTE
jgi:ribonuclease P protein component